MPALLFTFSLASERAVIPERLKDEAVRLGIASTNWGGLFIMRYFHF